MFPSPKPSCLVLVELYFRLSIISDGILKLFDSTSGLLRRITNLKSNASTDLAISWGWYNSSVGGCTQYSSRVPASLRVKPCDKQKSGAYIFRPNSSTLFFPGERSQLPNSPATSQNLM